MISFDRKFLTRTRCTVELEATMSFGKSAALARTEVSTSYEVNKPLSSSPISKTTVNTNPWNIFDISRL